MEKVKLSDGTTLELVVNGIAETTGKLVMRVIASIGVAEAQKLFEMEGNTSEISILDQKGTLLQTPYTKYTVLDSIKLCKSVPIEQKNTGTEDVPVYEDVIVDVLEIALKEADALDAVQKQMDMLTECIMDMSEAVYA